ncbi:MAG: hypothetical protein JAY75_14980, partial [Candidatus Thiodiazotropha taylori]|nr:hypothetical protein [Candidatus Thiodiazotropha taylori]MCW4309519.1 hypothetical protein [Candidatus Thiodiazotropha endolucinida]
TERNPKGLKQGAVFFTALLSILAINVPGQIHSTIFEIHLSRIYDPPSDNITLLIFHDRIGCFFMRLKYFPIHPLTAYSGQLEHPFWFA